MRLFLFFACIGIFNAIDAFGQQPIAPVGTGATPFALAQDYRALRWNPAGLSFSSLRPDLKSAAGSLEGGASLRSDMLDRTDLWDDLLNRQDTEQNWTGLSTAEWIDRIKGNSIELNADVLVAGSYRRAGRWGFAYVHRQSFAADLLLSEPTASLLFEGGASSLFDFVVLASGDTLANSGNWNAETISSIVSGFGGGALLTNILDESRIGFNYTKSHEVGISRAWGDLNEGWLLHTGIGARLILGNGYFSVSKDENGSLDAFGAFSNGFNFPTLDTVAATVVDPTFDRLRNWGPVGQGWGVDLGVVLNHKDQIWASAALTNIGAVEWRGEKYLVQGVGIDSWNALANSPDAWIDAATAAMDPATWFDNGVAETRKIALPLNFQLGGGMRLGKGLTLAAEAAFSDPNNIQAEGLRGGATAVLRLLPWIRIDAGLRKLQDETLRIPVGIVFQSTHSGWEGGLQASDAQGLWKSSSPELGMNFCFIRWVWSERDNSAK